MTDTQVSKSAISAMDSCGHSVDIGLSQGEFIRIDGKNNMTSSLLPDFGIAEMEFRQ